MRSIETPKDSIKHIRLEGKGFSEEQSQRWNNDVNTMTILSESASSRGLTFVLSDGYAVEAHCGGKMTREHGDFDGRIYTCRSATTVEVMQWIHDLLSLEETKWKRHHVEKEGKIKFREDADGKEWKEKRRIELYVDNSLPPSNTQRKILIDSHGVPHEIDVEHIDSLVAKKVRIINNRLDMSEEEKRQHTRHLHQQDIDEVRRLVSQPDFSHEQVIYRIAETIARKQHLDIANAVNLAKEQYERVLSLKI